MSKMPISWLHKFVTHLFYIVLEQNVRQIGGAMVCLHVQLSLLGGGGKSKQSSNAAKLLIAPRIKH